MTAEPALFGPPSTATVVEDREAWRRLVRRLTILPGQDGYLVPVHPDDDTYCSIVALSGGEWAVFEEVDPAASALLDEALHPMDAADFVRPAAGAPGRCFHGRATCTFCWPEGRR